jgi:hypothetical protein
LIYLLGCIFFPFGIATFVFGTATAWCHFDVTTAISFATLAGIQAHQLLAMAMKSLTLIQDAWRRTNAVELLAVAIGWRGMQFRVLLSLSIESATLIQTAWRGTIARRLLATAVESATLIQSVCRRYLAFRFVAERRIWRMLCANVTDLPTKTRYVLSKMAPKLDNLPVKHVAEIVCLLEKGFSQSSAVLNQEEAIPNEVETLDTNFGPVVCTRTKAVANAPFVSSWSLILIISCCFFR